VKASVAAVTLMPGETVRGPLLLVWLVLLGLLTGWTDDFIDICRQLLT